MASGERREARGERRVASGEGRGASGEWRVARGEGREVSGEPGTSTLIARLSKTYCPTASLPLHVQVGSCVAPPQFAIRLGAKVNFVSLMAEAFGRNVGGVVNLRR